MNSDMLNGINNNSWELIHAAPMFLLANNIPNNDE